MGNSGRSSEIRMRIVKTVFIMLGMGARILLRVGLEAMHDSDKESVYILCMS